MPVVQGQFTAEDGATLRYRHWPAAAACDRAVLLVAEEPGRWREPAAALADFNVFAWEPRAGAGCFMTHVRDAEQLARHIEARHGIALETMAAIATGLGATIAATWAHDYAPPLRALVLVNPNLPRWGLGAGRGLRAAARRIVEDAAAIVAPAQLLITDGGAHRAARDRLFGHLGSALKDRHEFATAAEARETLAAARRFVAAAFANPPARADLGEADRRGPWKEEFDANTAPLPWFSARRWGYAGLGLAMRSIGRLSRGIDLGLAAGFDSGPMFDHVYRDKAKGITPLGRRIDRDFLNRPGWRAVRARRRHLEAMLGEAVAALRAAGAPIHVVEIGAGGARYTLEALRKHAPEATALLLDRDPSSVAAARALAAELGMGGIRSEIGDGFDRAALAGLRPKPTISLVSGLYEQHADNAPLRESLAGLAAAMPEGSHIVYTNQIWNPQLAFISRMLTTRDGGRWVMRRRSQAEMDQLVAGAGFAKRAMAIDDDAIATVSLARRL